MNHLGKTTSLSRTLELAVLAVCLGASPIYTTPAFGAPAPGNGEMPESSQQAEDIALIQLAILLDTSGSMDGLIDQARFQVWNTVSELSRASRQGAASQLEIAVYQYGVNTPDPADGFVRQVLGFTEDLDEVSQALFSLSTKGSSGKEYCGQVIDDALSGLDWNTSPGVYRTVFIAGNESFDQGPVPFGEALPKALARSVVLNSIYCADPKYKKDGATSGMEKWEAAAKLTYGMYFQIDHNHHLPEMETPFDGELRALNEQMNETFVWFGHNAQHTSQNQKKQDRNAAELSDHAFAARMSAKIGHLYHHTDHDLIDAIRHGVIDLDKMPAAKMPEALQKMTPELRREFVTGKIADRNRVRREMAEVISRRHAFLERKMSEEIGDLGKAPPVLGDALVEAVRTQAMDRGFEFGDLMIGSTADNR